MIRPLNKKVIVKLLDETVSAGGIVISSEDKSNKAEVVSVAKDGLVTKGDMVLIDIDKAKETQIDGQSLVIVDEEDIIGVFT